MLTPAEDEFSGVTEGEIGFAGSCVPALIIEVISPTGFSRTSSRRWPSSSAADRPTWEGVAPIAERLRAPVRLKAI